MKIILVTSITPYKENLRGTSGIQYHLLVERNKRNNIDFNENIDVIIYSFNNNKLTDQQIKDVENELNVKIRIIPRPKWICWALKYHLMFIRVILRYPIYNYFKLKQDYINEINSQKPDGIWIYGQELSRITRQFDGCKRIHTLPDSEALYYYRMLGQRFVFTNQITFWRQILMYPKYLRMEHEYPTDKNIHYHTVGIKDADFLKNNNTSIQAHFIHHPHYELAVPNKKIQFSKPKIKLLIAGRNDLYMHQSAEELFDYIIKNGDSIKDHYVITFLGKGWENDVVLFVNAGFDVKHIKFAPDYIEEVCKHDIQITPITIGTGTKGKVLDALANGLLVIGTYYALENIAVKNGESCIEYNSPEEVLFTLKDILNNVSKYERMAELGRKKVLSIHNRFNVSHELFSWFKK